MESKNAFQGNSTLYVQYGCLLYVTLCYQKTKKKKEKKAKKEKKSKKDKKLLRADYEEAEGITTPSKEQVPPSQAETPVAVQLPVS